MSPTTAGAAAELAWMRQEVISEKRARSPGRVVRTVAERRYNSLEHDLHYLHICVPFGFEGVYGMCFF